MIPITTTAIDDAVTPFLLPETIDFPGSNLYTPEKVRLGRALFFDPRLSASGSLSCSSCHNPAMAYTDGAAKSEGSSKRLSIHKSPTIINAAWNNLLMWDGHLDDLEAQVISAMHAQDELNMPKDLVATRLSAIEGYRKMFASAFPDQPITDASISQAIATYERTIVSGPSAFDAWIQGDETALSGAAKNGFAVFKGKAHCVACHSGWAFSDNGFHDVGLQDEDLGRGVMFPDVMTLQHAFKTPNLREIDHRAPYMHDGSLPTLEAVVEHYDKGGVSRPGQSPLGSGPINLFERRGCS